MPLQGKWESTSLALHVYQTLLVIGQLTVRLPIVVVS